MCKNPLFALIDWYSRFIVGWTLANSMTSEHGVETLDKALLVGTPEICNADQGSQFTGHDWIARLNANGIKISHDGVGRCIGRVENWRACLNANVSSSRSSNRTCAANASGFRTKHHAFALGTSSIACATL